MSNKETTEFAILIAKFVNSLKQATAEDGFNLKDDFQYFIDDLIAAPAAFADSNKIAEEGGTMTNEDKVQIGEAIMRELPDLDLEDAVDFKDFIMGNYGIARFFWRRGYDKAVQDLKSGVLRID